MLRLGQIIDEHQSIHAHATPKINISDKYNTNKFIMHTEIKKKKEFGIFIGRISEEGRSLNIHRS